MQVALASLSTASLRFQGAACLKLKWIKLRQKHQTRSTPAPRDDRQPVVKSTPSYDFGSSNDDNDPPPVVYTPPPVVYTPPDPVYTYYDPDPTPTPDPVTVSPTDTSNVYDFYEPDPVTVSPTDTSNVYDFYEPDPVTVYDGGSNDEETVMLQPVTYTGPAVETTLDTGDFSLDDLDLGTGVAPVDETSPFVFDADTLSQITNIRGITPPQTNWVGNNTQEASNVDPNSRYDFDPVGCL
jgi:hypothetical protein